MRARVHLLTVFAAACCLLLGALAAAVAPSADAAITMPAKILLKGGAAEVGFTWTATPYTKAGDVYTWPTGVTPHYQWYRGPQQGGIVPIHGNPADTPGFEAIPGATDRRYTLTNADHAHTIVVHVVASGQAINSAVSNWVLWRVRPPVLSGTGFVGNTITIAPAQWESDWDFAYIWRRDGNEIPGTMNARTYTLRAVDGGTGLSVLAYGEHTFPNGVTLIDRYATAMRILFRTTSAITGTSPARGQLRVRPSIDAIGLSDAATDLTVRLYDGSRFLRKVYLENGAKTVLLTGLSRGQHFIRTVYPGTGKFAASRAGFRVTVR